MLIVAIISGFLLFADIDDLFDTRGHFYSHTYESAEQCENVRKALTNPEIFKERKGAVCTSDYSLYMTK